MSGTASVTPIEDSAAVRTRADRAPRRIVVVTGLSGAGHSTSLKVLEDLGYECVDNLPLALIAALVDEATTRDRSIAVSVDTRTRDFSIERFAAVLDALKSRDGLEVRLVFVDCDADVLQRRFTETRRRHPLALDRPVVDGIRLEEQLLAPLRDLADLRVDTSVLTVHDLKRVLAGHFGLPGEAGLLVQVVSFSFRRGLPRDADLVFDVRFLENPHWVADLRPRTGLDREVQDFVTRDPGYAAFLESVQALLGPLLPRYSREGKSYLTIAFGCTGGRHRSVFLAETIGAWLKSEGYRAGVQHRDLPAAQEGSSS